MIDIHTHILPGIDDGLETIEESIRVLKKAANEGVKVIVCTPHVLEMPSERDWQRVRDTFTRLRQALIKESVRVEILLGAELFISPELPAKFSQDKELTIGNAHAYVLLELPLHEFPPFTEKTIFDLLLKGIVPIIAHPERCFGIQEDIGKLFNLVKRGALAQVNSGSLNGKYGRKAKNTAKTLLSHNLIQVISSDIHSVPSGPYPLLQGVELAAKVVGKKRALEMVTTVPEDIVNGKRIEILPPKPSNKTVLEWFSSWAFKPSTGHM